MKILSGKDMRNIENRFRQYELIKVKLGEHPKALRIVKYFIREIDYLYAKLGFFEWGKNER